MSRKRPEPCVHARWAEINISTAGWSCGRRRQELHTKGKGAFICPLISRQDCHVRCHTDASDLPVTSSELKLDNTGQECKMPFKACWTWPEIAAIKIKSVKSQDFISTLKKQVYKQRKSLEGDTKITDRTFVDGRFLKRPNGFTGMEKDNKKNSKKAKMALQRLLAAVMTFNKRPKKNWPGQPYLLEQAGQSWGAQPRTLALTQLV